MLLTIRCHAAADADAAAALPRCAPPRHAYAEVLAAARAADAATPLTPADATPDAAFIFAFFCRRFRFCYAMLMPLMPR
jgi:hypothetical protein